MGRDDAWLGVPLLLLLGHVRFPSWVLEADVVHHEIDQLVLVVRVVVVTTAPWWAVVAVVTAAFWSPVSRMLAVLARFLLVPTVAFAVAMSVLVVPLVQLLPSLPALVVARCLHRGVVHVASEWTSQMRLRP